MTMITALVDQSLEDALRTFRVLEVRLRWGIDL